MIGLYVDRNYLDIGVEILHCFEILLRLIFYVVHKELATISRRPDDMVLRLVHAVSSVPVSHRLYSITPYRLDGQLHHQTESGVFCCLIKPNL